MTREDFDKLMFHCTAHISMQDAHAMSYICNDIRPPILMTVTTPKKGRRERFFSWNGKDYRTVPSLIKAINRRNESFRKP